MRLMLKYTLKQLIEKYNEEIEIPTSLNSMQLSICGLGFIEANIREEPWVEHAVKMYLKTEDFHKDLECAKSIQDNGCLQLECDKDRKIHLTVNMDRKRF